MMTTIFRIVALSSVLALGACNSSGSTQTASASHLTTASPGAATPDVGPDGTVRRITTSR